MSRLLRCFQVGDRFFGVTGSHIGMAHLAMLHSGFQVGDALFQVRIGLLFLTGFGVRQRCFGIKISSLKGIRQQFASVNGKPRLEVLQKKGVCQVGLRGESCGHYFSGA